MLGGPFRHCRCGRSSRGAPFTGRGFGVPAETRPKVFLLELGFSPCPIRSGSSAVGDQAGPRDRSGNAFGFRGLALALGFFQLLLPGGGFAVEMGSCSALSSHDHTRDPPDPPLASA